MIKKKILVIEDEDDVRDLVCYNIERHGYHVVGAASGEEGLKEARKDPPDLIILDLMLPGIDGLEVCRVLKRDDRTASISVIMLTAKGEEIDIVTGLELGADDYVVKPFSPRVLVARVRSVLRKNRYPASDPYEIVENGELRIDPGRHEVKLQGQIIELTSSEFSILLYIVQRSGRVYTRNQIIKAVHGDDYAVTERSIDVQIVSLRKKLGDFGRRIESVRAVGYRFKDEQSE